MRWAPLHPRQMLAIAGASLVMALLLMLAAAPDLATLDFSIGSDAAESGSSSAVILDRPEATAGDQPVWVSDPLAPPLDALAPR